MGKPEASGPLIECRLAVVDSWDVERRYTKKKNKGDAAKQFGATKPWEKQTNKSKKPCLDE